MSGLRREILVLAGPSALSLFLNNLYGLNDLFWVKRLGDEAQAAVSVAGFVCILAFAFYEGLAIGVLSLSARAHGARDKALARRVLHAAVVLSVILSGAVAVAGLGFIDRLVAVLVPDGGNAGSRALEQGYLIDYLEAVFCGGLLLCLAPVIDHAFIAAKDSFTPFLLQCLAVTSNLILNPILIFGFGPIPALGVGGAGLATVLSRVAPAAIGLWLLHRRLAGGPPDPARLPRLSLRMLRVGAPATLAIGLYSIVYQVILATAFEPFGKFGRAALGNGFRLEGLAFCLIWGLAMASGSLAGHRLGAGEPDAAEAVIRRSVRYVLVLIVPVTIVFWFFPGPLADLLAETPEVRTEVVLYLKVIALSQWAVALQGVFEQSLMAAGYTLQVFYSTAFWNLTRIPLAWWMSHPTQLDLGLAGIWWCINITTYGKALTSWLLFRFGGWKSVRV